MLASLAPDSSRSAAWGPADLVPYDGNVVTVAQRQPRAPALAVIGNRIAAIASGAAIKPWSGLRTETIDLRRMTVLPGFVDSHTRFPFGRIPSPGKEKKK